MESGSELSKTVSDVNSKDLILLAHCTCSSFQLAHIVHVNLQELNDFPLSFKVFVNRAEPLSNGHL